MVENFRIRAYGRLQDLQVHVPIRLPPYLGPRMLPSRMHATIKIA